MGFRGFLQRSTRSAFKSFSLLIYSDSKSTRSGVENGDDRGVVRSHSSEAGSVDFDATHSNAVIDVDPVEAKDRRHGGIGRAQSPRCIVEMISEQPGWGACKPVIEIPDEYLRIVRVRSGQNAGLD